MMLIHGETVVVRRERMHGHLMVDPFGNSFQCRHGDGRGNQSMARLVQVIGAKKQLPVIGANAQSRCAPARCAGAGAERPVASREDTNSRWRAPSSRIEVSSTSLWMELSMSETNTVSPLRQRMIEDMAARKLNPHTQRSHISSCKRFAAWLKRSPQYCNARRGAPVSAVPHRERGEHL